MRRQRAVFAGAVAVVGSLLGAAVLVLAVGLGPLTGHLGKGSRPEAALSPALRSLRSVRYDPRFGLSYWTPRIAADERGEEASRAIAICRDVPLDLFPNCRTVDLLETASRIPGFFREVAP